jgi:hypothetical protein
MQRAAGRTRRTPHKQRESISATVRNAAQALNFIQPNSSKSDAVPLKQQMANEKQRYGFAALVQNGDRGR